jgi:5-methylcytosine-specific restriction enzyme A
VPWAAPRQCSDQPCDQFAIPGGRGRCAKHAKKANQQRGTTAERGYDHVWERLRLRKLRANPLCELNVICEGMFPENRATQVDHKIRISERPDLRLEWTNLQSVCTPCHAAKSYAERNNLPFPSPGNALGKVKT